MKKFLIFLTLLSSGWAKTVVVQIDTLKYTVDLDSLGDDTSLILIAKNLNLPEKAHYRFIGSDGYHPEKDVPYKLLKYGYIESKTGNLHWSELSNLTKCYNVRDVVKILVIPENDQTEKRR